MRSLRQWIAGWILIFACACGNSRTSQDRDVARRAGPRPVRAEASPRGAETAAPASQVPTGVIGVDEIARFDSLTARELAMLKQRRILWGHQSVGQNVADGVRALGFDMSSVRRATDFDGVNWGDAEVAENGDPERKIRSFAALMEDNGIGSRVEAASFKFCWIDFDDDTDAQDLLDDYAQAMRRIARRFPRVRFVHVTPPLTTDEPEANEVRWRYGRELIRRYRDAGVVFDLAAVISTGAQGQRCEAGGARRLCREWSSDSGHLNEEGSRRAAKAFIYSFYRALQ